MPDGQGFVCLFRWNNISAAGGDLDPDVPPGDPAHEPAASEAVSRRLRILIIEDNRDYADGLAMYFELEGHMVTVTYSGIDGVEAALRHPPEVVICDLGLPGMDGFEVARTLSQNPRTAGARLIAVTGYGTERDVHYSLECGFFAHLVKPVDVAEIIRLFHSEETKGS